jgi:hypothetical protein
MTIKFFSCYLEDGSSRSQYLASGLHGIASQRVGWKLVVILLVKRFKFYKSIHKIRHFSAT